MVEKQKTDLKEAEDKEDKDKRKAEELSQQIESDKQTVADAINKEKADVTEVTLCLFSRVQILDKFLLNNFICFCYCSKTLERLLKRKSELMI